MARCKLMGTQSRLRCGFGLALTCMAFFPGKCPGQKLEAQGGTDVLLGESPRIVVSGLMPNEVVTLHSFRQVTTYQPPDYRGDRSLAHAYAQFAADSAGRIDVDSATPRKGTYAGADSLGLLWSGEKEDWSENRLKSPGSVLIELERKGAIAGQLTLQLTDGADRVDVRVVSEKGLNGVFARPKRGAGPLPSILLLHGSEGGSVEEARRNAIRFAGLGYAAFGLNYFSWRGMEGIPKALVNIPVEYLNTARAWLASQADVNTEHVSLWGASKGAEYALVAAANLKWVDRAVACAPSSVVWSGFGRPPEPGEVYSSWSIARKSLPFVPYENYDEVLQGRLSAGGEHRRSLAKASLDTRAAARIPIEKSDARFLLLGSTRDNVWPSAEMTREIEATMRAANKGDRVETLVFDDAAHFICGTGQEPQRISPVVNPEGNNPTPEATARAAEQAWRATKRFLQR